MKKKNFLVIALIALLALPMTIACSSENQISGEDGNGTSLVPHYTLDGVYSDAEHILSYKITSESPAEVCLVEAIGSVEVVDIPSIVRINGKEYAVTSLKDSLFSNCYRIKTVIIPNSVKNIGRAFSFCILEELTIPESVTTIPDGAFYCSGMNRITLPSSLVSIGNQAFQALHLDSITIPNSVKFIGQEAFMDNGWMKSIKLGNSLTSISSCAFRGCHALNNITIPNSVTSIGDQAFEYCYNLTSIVIPDFVTSIGEAAFNSCDKLKTITFGNSLTTIGKNAFMGCDSLESLVLPNSLVSIESNAFDECNNVKSLTIYSKEIKGEWICRLPWLEKVVIGDGAVTIGDLVFRNCHMSSLEIANTVTTIGAQAFAYCVNLPSIVIPNSVTSIGDWAFENCGFNSMTIPNSVTAIGNAAFAYCADMIDITIGNSVPNIGYWTFEGCRNLENVTLGSSVASIGKEALKECKKLTSIHCKNPIPASIDENPFESYHFQSVTLYVPKGSRDAYMNAAYWREFNNIVEED